MLLMSYGATVINIYDSTQDSRTLGADLQTLYLKIFILVFLTIVTTLEYYITVLHVRSYILDTIILYYPTIVGCIFNRLNK